MADLTKVAGWTGETRANVVFVHGIDGHPHDTWRCNRAVNADEDTTFWPRWLAEDVPGLAVYALAYEAPVSNWLGTSMPMQDRVDNVLDTLINARELGDSPITLICHSLGGLIIKQVMLSLKEQEDRRPEASVLLNRIRQIVFIATPHTGARSATWLARASFLVWPTATARALVSNDPYLRKVNVSYRGLAGERRTRLSHRVYFETLSIWFGLRIVDEGSSDPGLDENPVPIHADHITIAKPDKRKSDVYTGVLNLVSSYPSPESPGAYSRIALASVVKERHWNIVPKIVRLGAAAAIGTVFIAGLVALLGPEPVDPPANDPIRFSSILLAISDDNERVRVAEIQYGRKLSETELKLVIEMRRVFVSPPTLNSDEEAAIRTVSTSEQLNAVLARLDVRPCKGSFDFVVADNELRCRSGEPVPQLKATGTGGPLKSLEALVFHFSGTDGAIGTLGWLVNEKAAASVHLLISRSGAVVQLVPFDRRAWHAGPSKWEERNLEGLNAYSIGIMFINMGSLKRSGETFVGAFERTIDPGNVLAVNIGGTDSYWEKYTSEQVEAAKGIVRAFKAIRPNIGLLGHSDITKGRKDDPGPAFPMLQLRNL